MNLLASPDYYDPHAVAGLLKAFLRELPVHILTRELHTEFFQVVGTFNSYSSARSIATDGWDIRFARSKGESQRSLWVGSEVTDRGVHVVSILVSLV